MEVQSEKMRGNGHRPQHRKSQVLGKKCWQRGYTRTGARAQRGCGITGLGYTDKVRNEIRNIL